MFCICVEDVENLCLYLIHSSFYTNKRLVLLNFIREINNCRPSGRLYSTVPMRKIAVRKNLTIFSIWTFFHEHSRITGLQGKGEDISLTPHYHFHPFHRHLDISRAITAESSPLHIASSRTRTGNLWFSSASH